MEANDNSDSGLYFFSSSPGLLYKALGWAGLQDRVSCRHTKPCYEHPVSTNHICIVRFVVKFDKTNIMDAITILKNEANNHRLLQIDLDLLASDEEQLEDVFDIIAVELRRNEESVPWEQVKQQLHNEGKL